ncbi:hypothetical protein Taro_045970, partial [Colocasia esculenta]|nr:hypothetical protein [Colocasia esculenta]
FLCAARNEQARVLPPSRGSCLSDNRTADLAWLADDDCVCFSPHRSMHDAAVTSYAVASPMQRHPLMGTVRYMISSSSSSSSSPPASDTQNNVGTTSASMATSAARKTRRRRTESVPATGRTSHNSRVWGRNFPPAAIPGFFPDASAVASYRRSEVNRKNKGVQKIFHYAGTQTFADIRKAELQKSGQDMDRSELFIVTHTRKDDIPVNSECVVAIMVASKYDIYSQVLGEDKPGRVQGLGTGPTPATLWGRTIDILKEENKNLGDRVKDLEERIAKLERTDSKCHEENDSVDGGVAPKESASVNKKNAHSVSFQ